MIDDFIDDATREQLLRFLLGDQQPQDPPPASPGGCTTATTSAAAPPEGTLAPSLQLPPDRWERRTTDLAGAAPTWGVRQHVLQELAAGCLPALREVGARLSCLYPECDIAHLPTETIQAAPVAEEQQQQQQGEEQQRQGEHVGEPEQREGEQEGGQLQGEQLLDGAGQRQGQQQGKEPGTQPPSAKCSRLDSGGGGGGSGDGWPPAANVDCSFFVANAAVAGDNFRFENVPVGCDCLFDAVMKPSAD